MNQQQASRLISKIRKLHNKLKHQPLIYSELADYTGMDLETIADHLAKHPIIYDYTYAKDEPWPE